MSTVRFLAQYTTCDLADALVKFGSKTGGFIPNLTNYLKAPGAVAGRAYTVLYAPLSDPRPLVGGYIDDIPDAGERVVVIGLTPELQLPTAPYHTLQNALYGGLMSTRAQHLGVQGTVVLGRIRDLDEHRGLGYPVWAYGLGSTAPKVAVKVVGVGVPIEVVMAAEQGGTRTAVINNDDYIVADVNGVGHMENDAELVAKVVEYMPRAVAADELVAEDIKRGERAGAAQKKRRAAL